MTSPLDWPAGVSPGQTITDAWGNQVVAGIRMMPAHVRGHKPTFLPTANTPIDLTGAGGLIDPLNRLGANGVNVGTMWAGLWSVHAAVAWSAYFSSDIRGCRFWFQIGATKYAEVKSLIPDNTYGEASISMSTSTVLVVPANSVIECRYVGISYPPANLDIDFAFCWIGPAA